MVKCKDCKRFKPHAAHHTTGFCFFFGEQHRMSVYEVLQDRKCEHFIKEADSEYSLLSLFELSKRIHDNEYLTKIT